MVTKGGTSVNGGDCKSLWCSRVPRCTLNNGESTLLGDDLDTLEFRRGLYTHTGRMCTSFLFYYFFSHRAKKKRAIISILREARWGGGLLLAEESFVECSLTPIIVRRLIRVPFFFSSFFFLIVSYTRYLSSLHRGKGWKSFTSGATPASSNRENRIVELNYATRDRRRGSSLFDSFELITVFSHRSFFLTLGPYIWCLNDTLK